MSVIDVAEGIATVETYFMEGRHWVEAKDVETLLAAARERWCSKGPRTDLEKAVDDAWERNR